MYNMKVFEKIFEKFKIFGKFLFFSPVVAKYNRY